MRALITRKIMRSRDAQCNQYWGITLTISVKASSLVMLQVASLPEASHCAREEKPLVLMVLFAITGS